MKFKESLMNAIHLFAFVLVTVCSSIHAQGQSPTKDQATSPAAPMTEGEVRRIDKDAGKLTLRHGPIQNLEMPAMSMVFKVADPKMLDQLKEGDKVRFAAERSGGVITVTRIETIK